MLQTERQRGGLSQAHVGWPDAKWEKTPCLVVPDGPWRPHLYGGSDTNPGGCGGSCRGDGVTVITDGNLSSPWGLASPPQVALPLWVHGSLSRMCVPTLSAGT